MGLSEQYIQGKEIWAGDGQCILTCLQTGHTGKREGQRPHGEWRHMTQNKSHQ